MYNVKTKAACRQDNRAFLQNHLLDFCALQHVREIERDRGHMGCVCVACVGVYYCFMY